FSTNPTVDLSSILTASSNNIGYTIVMRQQDLLSTLKEIYLFTKLDQNELEALSTICTLHHYDVDSCLFLEGETGHHLLILIEGMVTVYKTDDKGNEIIINNFTPISLIAEPALLQGLPYPSSATVKQPSILIKIELENFKKNFLQKGTISLNIINSLLSKVQLLQNTISMNLSGSAREKIINFYKNEKYHANQYKQYEIAALLSISPETLSRNLKKLEKEGLLKKKEHHYYWV
ncbi:MAG: Crp/Fnr family transcriptional regulator, partial [Thiovulaceae bacterium]|nr:Crp/Fnr family transcriptional regulator [Sulfurimonadaceae bacterium]